MALSNEDLGAWLMGQPRTLLVWGDTGDGKTALGGELAELLYLYGRSPAGKPLRTRLYSADEGGVETIRPYIEVGIVEPVLLGRRPKPWEWLHEIVQGKKLDPSGKWVPGLDEDIGMWMFEGATSMGEALRNAISGADNRAGMMPSMAADKDAHGKSYGLAQDRMGDSVKLSFALPGLKLWTARARRGEDDAAMTVLGPQVVGKALTAEMPSWFHYTFRVMAVPGDPLLGRKEAHKLFLGDHVDRGLKGLGNQRRPLDGGQLPEFIEPASLVEAFRAMAGAGATATESIKAKMRKVGLLK